MQRYFRGFFYLLFVFGTLFISELNTPSAFAQEHHLESIAASPALSATRTSAPMISQHLVDMRKVPQATAEESAQQAPLSTGSVTHGVGNVEYTLRKTAARRNVALTSAFFAQPQTSTPGAKTSFDGLSQTNAPSGSTPSDHALAVSSQWVFQGVNLSFALYNTVGQKQPGWPKTAQKLFSIPNPTLAPGNPPKSCSGGPRLADPRAFYDFKDNRFWAAVIEFEGDPANGSSNSGCVFKSTVWIATSPANGDVNGTWISREFDMNLNPKTKLLADYPTFGFDGQAIYMSVNLYTSNFASFKYVKVLAGNKAALEQPGKNITLYGFNGLFVGGTAVDTVQPVESHDTGVNAGLFINSYNLNFGKGQCVQGCTGVVVWALAKPGMPNDSITGLVIQTPKYSLAPAADEPNCTNCIDTLDTRISATPPYQGGLISFALETSANNGAQNVPAIFWGQVKPIVNAAGVLTGASLYQSGFFGYANDKKNKVNDRAASYGAIAVDDQGNLFTVLDYMSSADKPGVVYVARRATDPLGEFADGGIFLQQGQANYVKDALDTCGRVDPKTNVEYICRWGDYNATSVPLARGKQVWFAGDYSDTKGLWATRIGSDSF